MDPPLIADLSSLVHAASHSAVVTMGKLCHESGWTVGPTQRLSATYDAADGGEARHFYGVAVKGLVPAVWALQVTCSTETWLIDKLLRLLRQPSPGAAQSAMLELSNMAACGFGAELARQTGSVFMPGVPALSGGDLKTLIEQLMPQAPTLLLLSTPAHDRLGQPLVRIWFALPTQDASQLLSHLHNRALE